MSNNSLKISAYLEAKSSFCVQVNGQIHGQLTGVAKKGLKLRTSGIQGMSNFSMAFYEARQLPMANKELTLLLSMNIMQLVLHKCRWVM